MNSCEIFSSCQALNKLSVIVSYFTQDKQLVKEKKNNRVGPGQNKIGSETEYYKSSLETPQLDVLVCKGQSWFTPSCPASLLTVPVQTQSCATQMPPQGRACAFRAASAFAPKSPWAATEQGDSTRAQPFPTQGSTNAQQFLQSSLLDWQRLWWI